MRGKRSALSDGFPVTFAFQRGMDKKTLSIFVDESGRFQYPDTTSRFYIVSAVSTVSDCRSCLHRAVHRREAESW